MAEVKSKDIAGILAAIKKETVVMPNHGDPGAIQDCWSTVEEYFELSQNSTIQVNENGNVDWIGCLLQVDEVKSWGVLAYVNMPYKSNVYVRIKFGHFDIIGSAVMIPQS